MRISDWSSDVCSSDLRPRRAPASATGLRTAGGRRGCTPPVRAAAAPRSRHLFQRVHVVVGKAEMMADLVDQHMADQPVEPFALLDPFAKDRDAIAGDAVGHGASCVDAAFGERAPFLTADRTGGGGGRGGE